MKIRSTTLGFCLAMLAFPVAADSLLDLYQQALQRDPKLKAAEAAYHEARERVAGAEAQLLPVISASAQYSRNKTEINRGGSVIDDTYPAAGYSVNLRQPLMRVNHYYGVQAAEAQLSRAGEQLRQDRQDMTLRLVDAYFKALTARAKLASLRNDIAFYADEVTRSRKSFDSGAGTRTEIEEAQAKLDIARAKEVQAVNALSLAERTLVLLSGVKVDAAQLPDYSPEALAKALGEAPALPVVMAAMEKGNPSLEAARLEVQSADAEIEKNRAAHFPTVDLVASRTYSDSESSTSIGNKYRTDLVGLQLTVPLYSGGGMEANVRHAIAERDRLQFGLEATRQQIELDALRQLGGVVEGTSRLRAMDQMVASAEQALRATEKSYKAGTRTRVDILNARQVLSQAQAERDDAREDYAMAYFSLKRAMGELDRAAIEQGNQWFIRNSRPAAAN